MAEPTEFRITDMGMNVGPDRVDLHLVDGREVGIDSIHIMESTAGLVYASRAHTVWQHVIDNLNWPMPGHCGELPTFVIPPVSVRRDVPMPPRWKVYARLVSETLEPPAGPLGGGSQLVLVFFCDDLAGMPIIDMIRWHLTHLDEKTWRAHAEDWAP